jgi:hypothetical protein
MAKLFQNVISFLSMAALTSAPATADSPPNRPDVKTTKLIAACKLQKMKAAPSEANLSPLAQPYSLTRPTDDPLANYERTALGNWQMPAPADRTDPWVRLLLLTPKRPVLIDVAVLIDGKSFREARENWVDQLLAEPKTAPPDAKPTKPVVSKTKTASTTNAKLDAKSKVEEQQPNAEKDEPEKIPGVAAQARSAPTIRERLKNYLAASGGAKREEVDWLIAESGFGPAIIVLARSLSWQRAGEAPLWALLDQDSDGTLSATEVAERDAVLRGADSDSNDVVDVGEMRRLAKHAVIRYAAEGHSLVVPLDENTDWDVLAQNVFRIYGNDQVAIDKTKPSMGVVERVARGDASLDGAHLRELCREPADVTLRAELGGKAAGDKAAGLEVISVGSQLATTPDCVTATADVITLNLAGDVVEVSAVGAPDDQSDASQLAVGAVIDGNPLLRVLDQDEDGRLTLRERQSLGGLLQTLDGNHDGQVSASELPIPIRLAITLGPQVHQLLAAPTGAARRVAPQKSSAPPDWFVSMDKNKDGDLSRSEFLGTIEQFRQFDKDGDGLLSVREALQVKPGQ